MFGAVKIIKLRTDAAFIIQRGLDKENSFSGDSVHVAGTLVLDMYNNHKEIFDKKVNAIPNIQATAAFALAHGLEEIENNHPYRLSFWGLLGELIVDFEWPDFGRHHNTTDQMLLEASRKVFLTESNRMKIILSE